MLQLDLWTIQQFFMVILFTVSPPNTGLNWFPFQTCHGWINHLFVFRFGPHGARYASNVLFKGHLPDILLNAVLSASSTLSWSNNHWLDELLHTLARGQMLVHLIVYLAHCSTWQGGSDVLKMHFISGPQFCARKDPMNLNKNANPVQ